VAAADEIKEWWTKTLLNETQSVHPIFGNNVKVKVDGDVVTLTGEVESAEQVEEAEREAMNLDYVHHVVNKLRVETADETYHMQTVIGVFDNPDAAELTRRNVAAARIHRSSRPQVLHDDDEAREVLRERAAAAQIGPEGADRFLDMLGEGKVLVVNRVPEDDALRMISALEGSAATSIETLPPEPGALEEG
jgi:hypothetical protein